MTTTDLVEALNSDKPAAIIIGLDSMQGLQAARILRGYDIPILGIATDPKHHACSTNACAQIFHADTSTEAVIDLLLAIAPGFATLPVLVPCQDSCVRIVSRHRERLNSKFIIPLPDQHIIEQLVDKDSFYEYASANNLPVPATYDLENRGQAEVAAEKLSYPCLLKPKKRTAEWNKNTKLKVFKIESPKALLAKYDECQAWVDILVAQQWIAGDDTCLYSCNCYFDTGSKPLATFVARKLRQWPPETGSSCLGEEIRDDTVLNTALTLFQGINYRGLGYLEMKRDADSGEYFIIEPNIGRPTGRSAIAEAGGVELLYTMYCDALGLQLPANRTQQYTGAKWIDLRHDLQSAIYYWRRGDLSISGWWKSIRGKKAYAVLSARDPMPFLVDIKRALSAAFSRGR